MPADRPVIASPKSRSASAGIVWLWLVALCSVAASGQPSPSDEAVYSDAQAAIAVPVSDLFSPLPAARSQPTFAAGSSAAGNGLAAAFDPEPSMPDATAYLSQDAGDHPQTELSNGRRMRIILIAVSRHRADELGWLVRNTTSISISQTASAMRFQRN
ncbi:hypothetical protein [Bosea sp. RAC05]|uniref:hypothetical protein n=1 Tax=Bosea sp. RAC05 TaxID=1842539 RepID=UPI00083E1E7C|nr:hypothetical protein [Bosea sp. RAC05]AOG02860.1 hypothetical protein BSY19_5397 [Bosea sp. RAC05]